MPGPAEWPQLETGTGGWPALRGSVGRGFTVRLPFPELGRVRPVNYLNMWEGGTVWNPFLCDLILG